MRWAFRFGSRSMHSWLQIYGCQATGLIWSGTIFSRWYNIHMLENYGFWYKACGTLSKHKQLYTWLATAYVLKQNIYFHNQVYEQIGCSHREIFCSCVSLKFYLFNYVEPLFVILWSDFIMTTRNILNNNYNHLQTLIWITLCSFVSLLFFKRK